MDRAFFKNVKYLIINIMNTTISNNFKQISLAVLVGLMVLQTGCKKVEEKTLDTLNGTVWKGTEYEDDLLVEYTFIFQENSFTMLIKEGGSAYPNIKGTYEYNHPNITIHFINLDNDYISLSGIISGNLMIFYDDKGSLSLTKQ